MIFKQVVLAWAMVLWAASAVFAQEDTVWIQVEAHPNLNTATERARDFSGALPDVNGFSLGAGWYGIAIGPYARSDAEQAMRVYRTEGTIPRDSYIDLGDGFRQQFWPVGANVLNRGAVETPLAPETPQPAAIVVTAAPADETPAQAQRSERSLSRAERDALQVALNWAGTYQGRIDGAFGRGTRNAMARWQEQKGFDVTGILTTAQRAVLLQAYNGVLDDLNLTETRDARAGIEIKMPTGVVAFEKYEYPFAHYASTGDLKATVLLISQAGDQSTLFGLYDIMQTLDIVPLDGPRERKTSSFTLIGQDATRVSETRVALEDGMVKGFTLIWPAGDEERRTRLMDAMENSFVRLDAVLPPDASTQDQAIDLVAGLQVRKPRLSRSGFFVDRRGTVLTTAEAVSNCTRVTLDTDTEAKVTVLDTARGVAVLTPLADLAPLSVARFSSAAPRLNSEVAMSGYSYEGVLGAPSITFGTLSDVRGLAGEPDFARLALASLPGDAGGPVLDAGGGLLGMLLPPAQSDRGLPDGVQFALDREALQDVLAQAGMAAANTDSASPIAALDLAQAATGMTVLVSCWD